MRSQRANCTAIKALLFAALLGFASLAFAQAVGTVTHLSGPMVARKANGAVKVLAVKSEVENGDTLVTEKNTYAQIKFIDNGQITLRPGTTFKIENYAYDEGKPDGDAEHLELVKGGLRSVTGLLGKRNKEKFALKTPNATIGIRGTTFIAQYVPLPPALVGVPGNPPASPIDNGPGAGASLPSVLLPSAPPTLAPGLHLQVTDGAIIVTNSGGSLGFQAGQFGFVPSVNQPPVIVPPNPGIQFTPPPSFNTGSGGPTASTGPGQGQATDCIVR